MAHDFTVQQISEKRCSACRFAERLLSELANFRLGHAAEVRGLHSLTAAIRSNAAIQAILNLSLSVRLSLSYQGAI